MRGRFVALLAGALVAAVGFAPGAALAAEKGDVAQIGDKTYQTLEAAFDEADDGAVVKLVDNATVSTCLELAADDVTLDGDGHIVTAAAGIAPNSSGQMHLLTVTGQNVTIKNVTLLGTSGTHTALNLFRTGTATIENVVLNHSASPRGAALVVNNADVTVTGDFEVITGAGSWGGVNLDNKYGPTKLTFDDASAPTFNDVSGKNLPFVYVENQSGTGDTSLPEVVNESSAGMVEKDGSYFIHEHVLGAPENYKEPTTTTEGYTGDQYCTICGDLIVKGEVIPTIEPDDVVMFRLYNPNSGEHFYTGSEYERDAVIDAGWNYEGVGWIAPGKGAEVYRLYNPNAGDHHYTMSAYERDSLVKAGWKYEGVGWLSADEESGVPLLREYNPNAATGTHNYTVSQYEHDKLVSLGWRDEGIAWYAVK